MCYVNVVDCLSHGPFLIVPGPKLNNSGESIRIKIDTEREWEMLEVARKLTQKSVTIRANDDDPDDETMRPMTDEEVAEDVADVQDTISEILHAHPLFGQLGDWRHS
jgi:hypothetical protein